MKTVKAQHGGPRTPGPGKRIGRPPTNEPPRSRLIGVRVTVKEYAQLQRRAMLEAQSLSEYVRGALGL